jgi:hypothetical protein
MTEREFVEKAMNAAIPKVIESLEKQLTYSLDSRIVSAAEEQIVNHVTEWIGENLIPVIGEKLMNLKDTLESQSTEFCLTLVGKVFESAIVGLEEKLKCSWKREAIFSALFK